MDVILVSKNVEHESWSGLRTLRFGFKLRFVLCIVERDIKAQSRTVEADKIHGITQEPALPGL